MLLCFDRTYPITPLLLNTSETTLNVIRDFSDVFCPVVWYRGIRTLLSYYHFEL